MPSEKKTSDRDLTLIKVLERLSLQTKQHKTQIEDAATRIAEISKSQSEILEVVRRSETRQDSRQDGAEASLENFKESIQRYRSDMLSLVNEQDRIGDTLKALAKRLDMIAVSQEEMGKDLSNLGERFTVWEKTAHDHYEYDARQSDALTKDIADTNRNATRLHVETTKQLGGEHKDIQKQLADADRSAVKLHEATVKTLADGQKELQRQLGDMKQETNRRLLSLDGIEATLQVLMVRTEPPIKKPFIFKRLFRAVVRFFRVKLPDFFARRRSR